MNRRFNRWGVLAVICATIFTAAPHAVVAAEAKYDPLAVSSAFTPETLDLTVTDEARHRDIPIRIYLPADKAPAAVVLFSHGLGGSREGSVFLGKHWAQRGYVAVFLQHPGSDAAVWKEAPATQRMGAMQQAASLENYMLRVKDVPAVLDQLGKWQKADGHALKGRLDMEHIGMSGHSFGAVTTQGVSGQSAMGGKFSSTDTRIKAAVIFSPSTPQRGDPKQAFSTVKIPWMLMTGTKDLAPIGNADMASRLGVFPALPAGDKYELVLNNAEHSVFTDRALPGDAQQRNPNHHRVILAMSTAFWDAYLRDNADAKAWLNGDGPRAIMEKEDRWQKK